MPNKKYNRIMGSLVAVLLAALIFLVLAPPLTAVKLDPGTPSNTSVYKGTTITFNNVNLTIRGAERIPVNLLNFTVFNGSTEVAYVKFNVTGSEIEDSPSGAFTVTNITNISNLPYSIGGSSFGYDELTGENITTFSYGYGYNTSGYSDLTILYKITYTTHTNGEFTARLFVDSVTHTYASSSSISFMVSETVFNPYPVNFATSVSRPPINLSVEVNGTGLGVYFYFYNMSPITDVWTEIINWTGVSSGRYEFSGFTGMGNDWLWGNTTYLWSVNITDGSTWVNTTYQYVTGGLRYDVNNDTTVTVQDLSYTWGHAWNVGDDPQLYDGIYDVNTNGLINVQDLSYIWNNRT